MDGPVNTAGAKAKSDDISAPRPRTNLLIFNFKIVITTISAE